VRAFYHPSQAAHDPLQYMRVGRVIAPKDVPARVEALLGALRSLDITPEQPATDYPDARAAVHTKGFLHFLETAWERWQQLPGRGPEVWPNTFPYWSGRPEDAARPDCPAEHIIAQAGWYLGDLSVPMGPNTWLSVRESCNTAIAAADAILSSPKSSASAKASASAEATADRSADKQDPSPPMAYALCRPPGHHTRADRASGFCYLNNTAAAAQRLRAKFKRVAILDVDAHHGDGTQQIFYARPDVLTISIHADPRNYYPFFTGYANEVGTGDGAGFNLNLPLAHGSAGTAMMTAVDRAAQHVRAFGADALVVALGFDAHARDPIGVLKLESNDFAGIGACVWELGLPTVVVQEGGYAVDVLGDCLTAFLSGLVPPKLAGH
jgi:acetoin utilization deacetylase AcuC-like enzyme